MAEYPKPFMADLKPVYQAVDKDEVDQLNSLNEKWGKKYPVVMKT